MQRISTTVIGLVGEGATAGELEVAIRETVGRWRARAIELPDYYLLLDPGSWTATRRHWYLGLLHRAAPTRSDAYLACSTAQARA